MQEFGIPGKKPSISRTAILSGLTRKDIQRILNQSEDGQGDTIVRYNRAARVTTGWIRDKDFLDTTGRPMTLAAQGDTASFSELVRRYSGDMPVRAVLDELLRVNAIRELPDGSIQLLERGYVPRTSETDKLDILGHDVADLISTINHNIQFGSDNPLFQRKVMYDNLPSEAVNAFREISAVKSQALLEEFDRWLAQHDRDSNPLSTGSGRLRAGVGIYFFQEQTAQLPEEN